MASKTVLKKKFQALVAKGRKETKMNGLARRAGIGLQRFYAINSDTRPIHPTNEELDRLAKVVAEL